MILCYAWQAQPTPQGARRRMQPDLLSVLAAYHQTASRGFPTSWPSLANLEPLS